MGTALVAAVTIVWYGHAFFQLSGPEGVVVIDPFDNSFFDYPIPKGVTADVLLITHDHADHNSAAIIGGKPRVLRGEKGVGKFQETLASGKRFDVVGTATAHDEAGGSKRGKNTIYSFELGGIRFCHVGDLGHPLSKEQVASVGPVDVLFVPVGGFFTLSVNEVRTLIDQLKPRAVVPMHFKTRHTPKMPIAPVDEFLANNKDLPLKKIGASKLTLTKDELPKSTEVWLLESP